MVNIEYNIAVKGIINLGYKQSRLNFDLHVCSICPFNGSIRLCDYTCTCTVIIHVNVL